MGFTLVFLPPVSDVHRDWAGRLRAQLGTSRNSGCRRA